MRTIALVCGMAAVVFASTVMAYANQPQARPLDVLGWTLLALNVLALAWLPGRAPAVLAATAAATAAFFALGYALALWPAPALVALFSVVAAGRRALGWAGAAFLVAVPAAVLIPAPEADNAAGVALWALIVTAVAQLAEASGARRARAAEAERRAAEAERTREEEARRRAQEERLRVARELHDVTSHTVSVIALHAAVAAEAVARAGGPPEAAEALRVIRASSRQALTEMKAVLGVLRPPHAPGDGYGDGGGGEPRSPSPGCAQLPGLLGAAGLPVTLDVEGEPRTLPPAADLTVYRVVQEALTNTIRHAAATRARVTLTYETGAVTVRVDDDGKGSRAPRGHGLTGMAERVAAAGGRLDTGDGPGGGFRVAARLPA
ncbi:sensor histidine kinase [Nonomuraea spiralis]|uniref:histidine kinase n=1 Tax=Nonomuraea spiralis TaxID=46182 RepID=A0ABV5I6C5_9ACTN|nr:histidine kinase [Nonomuraea spiralis]